MCDMAPDHVEQAMLDDLRNGYGDRTPQEIAPVVPAVATARLKDWKRRTSTDAVQPS